MRIFARFRSCALVFVALLCPSVKARAQSQPWQWKFQPAAKSRWKLVVFERVHSLSAQDMIQASFGDKIKTTQKIVRKQFIDQASHRAVFDVDVLSSDARECQLRWTFRLMEAATERDSGAESTFGDDQLTAAQRAEMQKQRALQTRKYRDAETLAARNFTQDLNGASFSCAIGQNGKVTRFGGWNAWTKRVEAATDAAKNGDFFNTAFRPVLVPDELKIWIQNWTGGLPDAPQQDGQKWQFSAKIADLGALTPRSTVTRALKQHDAARAIVNETAMFIVAPLTPKLEPKSVAYTFSCLGTREAHLQVDKVSGLSLRTSRRQETKGHRGVIDSQNRVLQDEAFTLKTTSEIVIQPR